MPSAAPTLQPAPAATASATATLSIIVVSYNTRELTLACLKSVIEQTAAIEYELLVVDNASTDGSADAIAAAIPSARLIRLPHNLGFAAANNLAARKASGEFLLLLNPDTLILNRAAERAVDFARARPHAGIVGGRTFFGDMSLNYSSCHAPPTAWSMLCIALGLSRLFKRSRLFDPESLGAWPRDTTRQVPVVTGCFCLVRKALWDELGGFDEAFFMYGEDTDLCMRANRAGSVCMICPEARVIHYGGKSEPVRADKMIRLFRAKLQLLRKHRSVAAAAFGGVMLGAWALTRLTAFALLRMLKPSMNRQYEQWRDIWRRRREWRQTA